MEPVTGRVLSITPVSGRREVVVDVDPRAVCQRCAEGKGCGAGLYGSGDNPRRLRAAIGEGIDVAVGEFVEVSMQSGGILKAAGTVYGLPLGGALAGAALAWSLELGDAAAAVLGVLGLAIGLLVARRRVRSERCLQYMRPVVTAVSGHT